MTKTKTTKRVGPMMTLAQEYVRENPGCCIPPVAEAVGPNGSRQYGYRTVHRAIDAGLIDAVKARGRYTLMVPA